MVQRALTTLTLAIAVSALPAPRIQAQTPMPLRSAAVKPILQRRFVPPPPLPPQGVSVQMQTNSSLGNGAGGLNSPAFSLGMASNLSLEAISAHWAVPSICPANETSNSRGGNDLAINWLSDYFTVTLHADSDDHQRERSGDRLVCSVWCPPYERSAKCRASDQRVVAVQGNQMDDVGRSGARDVDRELHLRSAAALMDCESRSSAKGTAVNGNCGNSGRKSAAATPRCRGCRATSSGR